MVASHWLNCECLSLAGLLLGEEESLPSGCLIVKWYLCNVRLSLLDLQMPSGRTRELPLLASQLRSKLGFFLLIFTEEIQVRVNLKEYMGSEKHYSVGVGKFQIT